MTPDGPVLPDLAPADPRRLRALEAACARLVEGARRAAPPALLGRSRAAGRLTDIVRRVASTPRTTVLVHGERGVGKETVAREIHRLSARAEGPFVALRSTGLDRARLVAGVEAAEGGTLFLDEVSELSPELQAELAEFLQERQIRRGSAGGDVSADVRIVASTCRDLARRVAEHRLREDLAYRLNVLSVEVPPLRARREDLPELLRHELERLADTTGLRPRLGDAALALLAEHGWPGNLRELRNALERAALTAEARVVEPEDLALGPARPSAGAATPPPAAPATDDVLPLGDRSLRAVEEALVRRVLDETLGNRSHAARVLGVNRTTLYNKLKQYGITDA